MVSFSPMFHWTDQKIRVCVFSCVLALAVAHLIRHAAHAGLRTSVRDLLATLAGSQKTHAALPPPGGGPAPGHAHRHSPIQQHLSDLFDLARHAPYR